MIDSTTVMIDVPEGWRYGFPKEYNPVENGDLYEWIKEQGYPHEPEFVRQFYKEEEDASTTGN